MNLTGCNEYKILMHKLLDGEISRAEKEGLEKHITLCRYCAGELKALRSCMDLLCKMAVPEAGLEFTSRTVKTAFTAKRKKARTQKIASLCLFGLVAVISSLIIAGWSAVSQPAIRGGLLSVLKGVSKCSILLTALNKTVSAAGSALWTSGNVIYKIICSGCNPGFIYLTALLVMLFLLVMSCAKSSALLFNRR